MSAKRKISDSHPSPEERIIAIKSQVCTKTASDQQLEVKQFIDEYDTILVELTSAVSAAVSSACSQKP